MVVLAKHTEGHKNEKAWCGCVLFSCIIHMQSTLLECATCFCCTAFVYLTIARVYD